MNKTMKWFKISCAVWLGLLSVTLYIKAINPAWNVDKDTIMGMNIVASISFLMGLVFEKMP